MVQPKNLLQNASILQVNLNTTTYYHRNCLYITLTKLLNIFLFYNF